MNTQSGEHLSAARTLLTDSLAAVARAEAEGLPKTALIATASPALLSARLSNYIDLGNGLDSAGLMTLATAISAAAQSLHAELSSTPGLAPFGTVCAAALLRLQNMLAKKLAVDALGLPQPYAVVDCDYGDKDVNRMLNVDWCSLFPNGPGLIATRMSGGIANLDLVRSGHESASLLERLRVEPIESIGYRLLERAGAYRQRLLGSRSPHKVLVWRQNALLKEAAFYLMLRGYSTATLRMSVGSQEPGTEILDRVAPALNACCRSLAKNLPVAIPLADIEAFLSRLVSVSIGQFLAARTAARAVLTRDTELPKAVLTNSKAHAEGLGVLAACRDLGITLFGFQHAPTVEFHANHRLVMPAWDNVAADVTYVYAPQTKEELDCNPFAGGETVCVGAPSEMRTIARKAFIKGSIVPICYVSTGLYSGNVQMAAMKGVPDGDKAVREIRIVQEVLGRLPHDVLYKPYPATRYPDPDPVVTAASAFDNIRVFTSFIDFRYLVRNTRAIMTSRATSTLAWCVRSGKPVVFIDHPYDLPLSEKAREALSRAVFLFDWREADCLERMRALLSRPLSELEDAYREMEAGRTAFVRRFLDAGNGRSGFIAARDIADRLRHAGR